MRHLSAKICKRDTLVAVYMLCLRHVYSALCMITVTFVSWLLCFFLMLLKMQIRVMKDVQSEPETKTCESALNGVSYMM